MRRIALTLALLVTTAAAAAVTTAGADDTHTYRIELDNAFGIVEQSEVRVAGVKAGVVKELDVNASKKAEVTVEVSGPLSSFREDATCSSQPQSLIAEYFIDCQPGRSEERLPENGLVPVEQTFTTVQNDLVNNIMREPFRQRLALIINEFGTALAGNPENLNDAIRRGAPALRALDKALRILANQNAIIRDLNVNSDRIIGRLTDRRQDVVRFIQNANATSQASAERREDLSEDFRLLPDFLAELQPTLVRLGQLTDEQTPLLADLNRASGQLRRLSFALPAFNDASVPSLESLGAAATVGRRALVKGEDELDALRQATRKSYTAADQIANFLVDLDDPRRAVETDARAAEDTGRPAPTGYTGLEGLLNYVYWQTLAVNQFDTVGHLLHFITFEFQEGPCGHYNAHQEVPAAGGGETHSAANRDRCVSWVGPNQPGISQPLDLGPYHPDVCPDGSDSPELCDPAGARAVTATLEGAEAAGADEEQGDGEEDVPGSREQTGEREEPQDGDVPGVPGVPGLPDVPGVDEGVEDLLGLGDDTLDKAGQGLLPRRPGTATTNDLMNFLFGN